MNELKVQPLVAGGPSVSKKSGCKQNHHDEIVLKVQLGISDEVLCFGGQLATQSLLAVSLLELPEQRSKGAWKAATLTNTRCISWFVAK